MRRWLSSTGDLIVTRDEGSAEASTSRRWAVVIPVRGGNASKTRLDSPLRSALAQAFAIDTVGAALAAASVARVIVVTAGTFRARPHRRLRIVRDGGTGLHAAIRVGLAAIPDATAHRAILLGDLPALRASDLDEALALAGHVPRGVVADAAGTGTTLTTARAGEPHSIRFGRSSAALHRSAGYRALAVAARSTLRYDVDRLDDLHLARGLRVGPATAAALARVESSVSGS